jgi:hypothetical protein
LDIWKLVFLIFGENKLPDAPATMSNPFVGLVTVGSATVTFYLGPFGATANNTCVTAPLRLTSALICCYPQDGHDRGRETKMKSAVFVLPLLAATFLFAFAAPPVYLGAKGVDELNEAAKKAGQSTMAYNTPDSFEKVYEFFKSQGTEEQRAHRVSAREKFAMIMFKDAGYTVAISWKEDTKSNGTVIHVAKGVPAR